MVDDSASEVELRWLVVPGVVRHVWRTVARHLTVSHGTVGLAESSQTGTSCNCSLIFPNSDHMTCSDAAHVSASTPTSSDSIGVVL